MDGENASGGSCFHLARQRLWLVRLFGVKGRWKKVKDLEFAVVGEPEIPQELKQIIAQKQTAPFKLTYSDEQNLYIAVGYGVQPTGGYSISVNELT